ncbi:MAG: InlB B-repeat-containing protein [Solirubrobacterales bacterium]
MAVAPDGATTVVWSRNNGGNYIVQARTRPAGSGTFGAVQDLSAPAINPSLPQLAIGGDGMTTVVWSRDDGSNAIVQARTRPAGSGTFGSVEPLSAAGGYARNAQVAVAPDGATTVVWRRDGGSGEVVEYASSTATNYTLTSQLTGDGTGTVSSTPAGIDCGSTCSAGFPLSSSVTLTADPAAGSTFAGWGGDCSGSSTTCTVTILGDRNVTATFTADSPAPPPADKPDLKVSLTAPKRVTGGKSFGVKLKVTNRAGGVATSKSLSPRAGVAARSVKTCLTAPSPLITVRAKGAKINGRTACWTRSTLGSGKSVTYSAKIKAPRSASGRKSLKATVRASDTAGDVVKVTGRAKVKVKKAKPPRPEPPTG